MKNSLFIRGDASPSIGTGHVMRCLALAMWAKARGWSVRVSGQVSVDWLRTHILALDIPFTFVRENQPPEAPPCHFPRQAGFSPDDNWVVLDGYHFSLTCQQAVREAGHKLLVIDDYAHLPEYSCDILLNQNMGAAGLTYHGSIGTFLLEPSYALLRPEFTAARQQVVRRRFRKKAQNILVSLGGGDSSAFWEDSAGSFADSALTDCVVRIIAGATPEGHIQRLLRHCPAKVEILERVDDMPALLNWAELCVSAGGSTCWELCCLGLPFVLVALAENQENIVHEFIARGLSSEFSRTSLITLLEDNKLRQAHSGRLRQLVSGNGASCVLDSMEDLNFTVQRIVAGDCIELWKFINSPEIREYAASLEPVPLEEHQVWFIARLQDPLPFFTVRNRQHVFCGYVRFARTANRTLTVSTALAPELRGKGAGQHIFQHALAELRQMEPHAIVEALVRSDNAVSQSFFTKLGFEKIGGHSFHGKELLRFRMTSNL